MGKYRRKPVQKEDVVRELAKIAFGKANDCMRLVSGEDVPVEGLDLSLLKEVKRYQQGVEIKLLDRLQALKQLAEFLPEGESGKLEELIRSVGDGEEE